MEDFFPSVQWKKHEKQIKQIKHNTDILKADSKIADSIMRLVSHIKYTGESLDGPLFSKDGQRKEMIPNVR